MKIVHVAPAYHPVVGGAEYHVQKLSEQLVKMGHDVRVVTTNVGSVHGYFNFDVPSVKNAPSAVHGIDVQRISYGAGVLRKFGSFLESIPWEHARIVLVGRLWFWMQRHLEKKLELFIHAWNPDLLMAMPHLLPNVTAAIVVANRTRKPLVLLPLLHERDPHWDRPQHVKALRNTDAVVANTNSEREQLIKYYGVDEKKVFTGWLGVDVDHDFAPRKARSGRKILFLGRQSKTKNIDQLILAMQIVWQRIDDAELIIAGAEDDGTVQIGNMIGSLSPKHGMNVDLLCDVAEAVKNELLATSTCLVLPSAVESFGIVLLEAWSFKTPVITLDLPVFRDIVTHGEDGYLVNPGNPHDLASAIVALLGDEELARKMGESGFRQLDTKFQWSQVAERYLQAYQYAIRAKNKTIGA